jgi:hypothetical protein
VKRVGAFESTVRSNVDPFPVTLTLLQIPRAFRLAPLGVVARLSGFTSTFAV